MDQLLPRRIGPQPLTSHQPSDEPQCAGRRSHVVEETDETIHITGRLSELLGALEQKLSSVLNDGPRAASTGGDKATPAPYRVPIAEKIRCTNGNLCELADGLEELLPRIEL